MIVSEDVALSRLNSSDNLINKLKENPIPNPNVVIDELHKNRTGPKNIPPMIQTLAIEAAAVSTQAEAAKEFGIAQQTVGYYAAGNGKANHNLAKSRITEVHDKALDAMLSSIELLKPKLDSVKKATDLAVIASNLGRVIEKTSPKEAARTNVKVVVFAPNQRAETEYETIDAQ